MGMLDKNWSGYCAGMKIEHDMMLNQYPVTFLTGLLVDQAALIGVINTLFDLSFPLLAVECVEYNRREEDEACENTVNSN
jgi:hypothetical protein